MALWKVKTLFTGTQGGAGISTMYFDGTAGTAAQANAAVGAFWTFVATSFHSSQAWTTDSGVESIDVSTGQILSLTGVTPVSGTGGSAADPLPWETQGLVQWRTGDFVAGRELRGRTFLPAMLETGNTGGLPTAGIIANSNSAAATLIASASADLVIYSLTHHVFAPVVTGVMWSQWAGLKSRRL